MTKNEIIRRLKDSICRRLYGPEYVSSFWGTTFDQATIRSINGNFPFGEWKEIERILDYNCHFIYQTDRDGGGNPLTMKRICELLRERKKYEAIREKISLSREINVLGDLESLEKEPFFNEQVPTAGWRVVGDLLEGSVFVRFPDKIMAIRKHLRSLYCGHELPYQFRKAFDQFSRFERRLKANPKIELVEKIRRMADLEVSKLFLPTPVELLYEIALLNSCDNYFTRKFFALTNCPDMDGFSLLGIGDLSTDGSVDIGRGCDDLDIYLPAFSGVSFRMPPVK